MAQHETPVIPLEYNESLQRSVAEMAEEWARFCALSEETQDSLASTNAFNGVGFERKTGSGTPESHMSHDRKLNFDITKAGLMPLMKRLEGIENSDERVAAQKFLVAAARLSEYIVSAVTDFGESIETNYSVPGFRALAANSAESAFFRALYYPPTGTVGDIIGEPHVDNSGFTLHLFESTDGCEYLDTDTLSWKPMPIAKGHALAFPSMQTQLASNGEVDGLCHRIVANETTRSVGRTAIVCFVPLDGIAAYDRASHGRLQERTPGFNYGMSPDDFSRLFVSS